MHGYIDSFPVPVHLSSFVPAKPAKGKGKEKDGGAAAGGEQYDVVANWTAQEREDVERKVSMAALCKLSQLILCSCCV